MRTECKLELPEKYTCREELGNREKQRQSKMNENPDKTMLAEVSSALETTDQWALVRFCWFELAFVTFK